MTLLWLASVVRKKYSKLLDFSSVHIDFYPPTSRPRHNCTNTYIDWLYRQTINIRYAAQIANSCRHNAILTDSLTTIWILNPILQLSA
jgi:hypothetical protein